jgi:hypothetical protein
MAVPLVFQTGSPAARAMHGGAGFGNLCCKRYANDGSTSRKSSTLLIYKPFFRPMGAGPQPAPLTFLVSF